MGDSDREFWFAMGVSLICLVVAMLLFCVGARNIISPQSVTAGNVFIAIVELAAAGVLLLGSAMVFVSLATEEKD